MSKVPKCVKRTSSGHPTLSPFMRVHLEMRVLYLDSARADKLYVPIIYIVETQFISYRQA